MRSRRFIALFAMCASVTSSFAAERSVSASDPAFRYEGRLDTTQPGAPVVIWQGTRISIDFEGDSVALLFDDIKGQVFFDATIDGTTTRVELREGQPPQGATIQELGDGRHELTLFKRSEAAAGTARFQGIVLEAGGKIFSPEPPAYATRMLFLGDSITVGANNEDGVDDQWDDRSTHNNARSYGAFTAKAFKADYRNIAVSGMGICEGYVPFTVKQIWDRVYPAPESPRTDLSAWTPDMIFVNWGENDDSFTKNQNSPFPKDFTREFVAVIRSIRAAWPKAQIVLLRGGMFGGAKSDALRAAWESAVAELEKTDNRVSHFVFTHWTDHHPRVADHRAMAAELIAWLKTQPFMAK